MSSEKEINEEEARENLRKAGYSEQVIEHWLHPKNLGTIDKNECDGDSGWYTGPCGDSMRIFLKIRNGVIQQASFISDICIGAVSAADALTEMVRGKKVSEALALKAENVIKELGGLPAQEEHCAKLATITLKKAIADYEKYHQCPWKKPYEKK
ncbi:MAG: NifU-like protein [Thermoanaerobacterales bacterium 50_218]|nr:MAG: NifU-like protein [Thermoanaerobacterales bacterium 50_218]